MVTPIIDIVSVGSTFRGRNLLVIASALTMIEKLEIGTCRPESKLT